MVEERIANCTNMDEFNTLLAEVELDGHTRDLALQRLVDLTCNEEQREQTLEQMLEDCYEREVQLQQMGENQPNEGMSITDQILEDCRKRDEILADLCRQPVNPPSDHDERDIAFSSQTDIINQVLEDCRKREEYFLDQGSQPSYENQPSEHNPVIDQILQDCHDRQNILNSVTRHTQDIQEGAGSEHQPSTSGLADIRKGRKRKHNEIDDDDNIQPSTPSDFYRIDQISQRHVKKYKAKATDYTIKMKNTDELSPVEAMSTLSQVFEDLLDRLTAEIRGKDFVRFVLQAPGLDKAISLPFIKRDDLTVDRVMTRIEHVLQSHEEIKVDDAWDVNFIHMVMPEGGRTGRKMFKSWEEKKKHMRCIIRIDGSEDSMCCAKSIVTGIAKQELRSTDADWHNIRRGRYLQAERALELHRKANVPEGPCGLKEVEAFQDVIPNYQICVVSKEQFNRIIYQGPPKSKGIYLLYSDQHYDLITSMSAYMNRGYWCHPCKQGYNSKENHLCEDTCKLCYSGGCKMGKDIKTWKHCQECNRYFKDMTCYDNHKKNRYADQWKTVCKRYYRCKECNQFVNNQLHADLKKKHDCTESYCNVCKNFFPVDHKCYMKPASEKRIERTTPLKYIFFDFECTQDGGIHKPNLCVVQKVCEDCIGQPFETACNTCGEEKQKVFKGETCRDDFCSWLLGDDKHKYSVCIAHNMQGYDGYFILQYLYENAVLPEVIMNGGKAMMIRIKEMSIRFIDSLNFFPMPLSKLPKAFGISECKGFFPHLFNTKLNQNYVGPIPDPEYFDPDGMSEEGRNHFYAWYRGERENNEQYDMQEEILKYCILDVEILRQCCVEFRYLFKKVTVLTNDPKDEDTGIDPFEKTFTIAGVCNLVLRRNFLKPDTIAIIPPRGYRANQNYSKDSIRWLTYLAHRDNVHIRHALNGGEVRIGQYTVDGFCAEKKRIYEYQGCVYH